MTPEQMEKTMQFILETQAKLDVSVHEHHLAIRALEEHAARHDREIQELTNLVGRLATAQALFVQRMDEGMAALRDVQKETAERLNALIIAVEKYIVGRNGGQRPSQ